MKEDLDNLLVLGLQMESLTCNGHKVMLKAIGKSCPGAILQRRLIHIQRMCRLWLTKRSKSQAGLELRNIVNQLPSVDNHEQRDYWLASLVRWHREHEAYLKEKVSPPKPEDIGINTNCCGDPLMSSEEHYCICFTTRVIPLYRKAPRVGVFLRASENTYHFAQRPVLTYPRCIKLSSVSLFISTCSQIRQPPQIHKEEVRVLYQQDHRVSFKISLSLVVLLLDWFGASACRKGMSSTFLPCSMGIVEVRITNAWIYSDAENKRCLKQMP